MAEANNLPGLYVVLDGIVGCGKSAQTDELKKHLPEDFPGTKFLFTYEPGGTPEADKLRKRLKHETMSGEEEAKLFAESRAITTPKLIVPALLRKKVVISDRSVTTSLAYQGFGRNLGIEHVWETNKDVVNGIFPDVLIYINVGIEAALARSKGDNPDKFDDENISFWERNVKGYDAMIKFLKEISPETKVIRIDDPEGKLSIEQTRLFIKEKLYPLIEEAGREGQIVRKRQK